MKLSGNLKTDFLINLVRETALLFSLWARQVKVVKHEM